MMERTKEKEVIYFGVYHGNDVDHEMVKHLIKAVNEGRRYNHDVCALVEQDVPGGMKWGFMGHIDIGQDDGLLLRNCSTWGDVSFDGRDLSAGYVPGDGEACIVRETTEVICFNEGRMDISLSNDTFSLAETRVYLGEMARARLFHITCDYRSSLPQEDSLPDSGEQEA